MSMLEEHRRVVVPCSTGSETQLCAFQESQPHSLYLTEILTGTRIPFSNIVRKYIPSSLVNVTKKIN